MNFREVLKGFAALAVRNEVTRVDVLMLADAYEEEGKNREAVWLRYLDWLNEYPDAYHYSYQYHQPTANEIDAVMQESERVDIYERISAELRKALKS